MEKDSGVEKGVEGKKTVESKRRWRGKGGGVEKGWSGKGVEWKGEGGRGELKIAGGVETGGGVAKGVRWKNGDVVEKKGGPEWKKGMRWKGGNLLFEPSFSSCPNPKL